MSPRPLQEKLTLFWHGHFATSAQKVRDAYLMWLQNDTFRRNAAGNWLTMLTEVTKDPAMLIWLDQTQSRKAHPNEKKCCQWCCQWYSGRPARRKANAAETITTPH